MNHPCHAASRIHFLLHDSLFCRSQQRVSLPPKRHKDAATSAEVGAVGIHVHPSTESEHGGKAHNHLLQTSIFEVVS